MGSSVGERLASRLTSATDYREPPSLGLQLFHPCSWEFKLDQWFPNWSRRTLEGLEGLGTSCKGKGGGGETANQPCCPTLINQSSQVLYKIYPLTKGFHCKRKLKTSCSRGFLLPAILCFYQISSFIQQFNKHLLTVWMLTGKPSPCF